MLSIAVVLSCRFLIPPEEFAAWGWRVPFLLSIILLAISLWMRLKLSESPVFRAMKEAGKMAGNPFTESFTYPGNKKRIFVALFGITGGLTTIWYTAFFSGLSFLRGPMRVDELTVEILVFVAGLLAMYFYLFVGKWSDRVGRKKPIIIGNILILLLLFPCFWALGHLANPGLWDSTKTAPVQVAGQQCSTDPFADLVGSKPSDCGKILEALTASGVPYDVVDADQLRVTVGDTELPVTETLAASTGDRKLAIESSLMAHGYDFSDRQPSTLALAGIVGVLLILGALSAMNYGSVAALLSEMFPAQIRYSSMSIPYHIGAGYFGGFLPLIAGYIVARSGDVYAGLWYTWIFVFIALVVGWWGIPDDPEAALDEGR